MPYVLILLLLGILLVMLYHKASELFISVRQERDILKSKLTYMQESNNSFESEIAELKAEAIRRQEKLAKLTEEMDAMASSNAALVKEKNNLAVEIRQLQAQLSSYEKSGL